MARKTKPRVTPRQARLVRQLAKQNPGKLVSELIAHSPNRGIRLRAMQIRDRLVLPMDKVLAKVPGNSVTEKCEFIGVSRQAYYYWLRGMSRPNQTQAKRLQTLTGFDWVEIRGKTRLTPFRPASAALPVASRRVQRNRNNLPARARP